ncbi:MAG: hypothetical protein LBV12_09170 [Puniceicoccales bacterium]|jgi:exopolyphosphatase/guanosine-5'-triphosphate,3'-diphosphate pyrophosphatase|nr:hypothetical protein [Puniceicoccales bacterium]
MPLAVIDIGSNTIKILIAEGLPLRVLAEATEEVRLSPRNDEPQGEISPRAQEAGIAAIGRLLDLVRKHKVEHVRMVATSMLRDAKNSAAFRAELLMKTGYGLEILSGEDEARSIAAGVATDPELSGMNAFRIIDLGGGSMEYISSGAGDVKTACSWPLGAVRLTRQFFSNPAVPIPDIELTALDIHVRKTIGETMGIMKMPFVGCGGAFSVARAVEAASTGVTFEKSSPRLAVSSLLSLRNRLIGMTLDERASIPALPAGRADILPAALTVLLAVADITETIEFIHSRRNLRYGVAMAMMSGKGSQG